MPFWRDFPDSPVVKNPTAEIPVLTTSEGIAGEGNGTPLQYSCLENPWTEEPDRLQSIGSLRVGHD